MHGAARLSLAELNDVATDRRLPEVMIKGNDAMNFGA
jgi:hypothetical protein